MPADGLHFNDTEFTSDWDGVWETKVADTGHGYSVEFRIPLGRHAKAGLLVELDSSQ
jgi:hypothetical protein